jgi:hypothetical protein
MNKRFFIKVMMLFAFGSFASFCLALDTYWISYTGFNDVDRPDPNQPASPGGPKYMMKIDVLGNVLIPPTKIDTKSTGYRSPSFGGTALSRVRQGTRLAMWFPHYHELANGNHVVWKAIIDKSTLRIASLEKTEVRAGNITVISAKQRAKRNFVTVEYYTGPPDFRHLMLAYSARNPANSWLLQECLFGLCTFGVSADGKVFYYSQRNSGQTRIDLIFQRLDRRGRPTGNPEVVASGSDPFVIDVTSVIGNKRYFVYGNNNSSVLLQVIDAKTGKKVGDKIRIANNTTIQAGAIDPLGRFVIYYSAKGDINPIYYQALDATGHPSGSRKQIATGFGGGLDIREISANRQTCFEISF